MGQIIGSAAKPKRCNLNKLSQLGTPAAGEHILVSSDNSMNAAGQGNFDCYIVGDGQTTAAALPRKSISPNDAVFVGTFNTLNELLAVQNPQKNAYGFVIAPDEGANYYNRYKFNGTQWLFECKVGSTPFTDAQWDAIQSGVTSAFVEKFESITPQSASASNKLVDKNYVVEYNILDYEGNTLNERWNAMKQDFVAWKYKHILIPHPREDCSACIKVGNDWKWKVSAPIAFNDSCNCSYVEVYGELYAIAPVSQVLLFYDVYKPENIYFTNGIEIRGNRHDGNTIGCAIEIRAGARINFSGQVIINDCNYGIIVGGENQQAPSYASFNAVQVSFFDTNAVYVYGDTYPSGISANGIGVSCAQSEGLDAIKIEGSVVPLTIRGVSYGTDVAKDGYLTYDANAVVLIKGSTTKDTHVIRIGTIYSTQSTYGLYIDGQQMTHISDVMVDYVGIATNTGIAVYARYCTGLIIGGIKNDNTINIASCIYSNIFAGLYRSGSTTDRLVGLSGTIYIDTTTAFTDLPSISGKNLGAITIVKNANGKHVYINDGNTNILLDGQMYVPNVSSLPTPAWNLRGKMYRVNNDSGQDVIAVCIRYGGNAYKWFDLVAGAVI